MFSTMRVVVPVLLLTAATAFAAEPAAQQKASTDAMPAVDTSAPQAAPAESKPAAQPATQSSAQAAAPGKRAQNDRLDLDTTIVTGNRELPKVLYIVPWKKADLGELPAQPFNTLLDEVLTPVDRDVFRREVTYYGAVAAGGNASPAAPASPAADPAAPARGDEK
jgi:hypothetical protein